MSIFAWIGIGCLGLLIAMILLLVSEFCLIEKKRRKSFSYKKKNE